MERRAPICGGGATSRNAPVDVRLRIELGGPMGGPTNALPYIDSMLRRALRSARRSHVIAYSTVVVLVVVLLALDSSAAPCANWKDGSCESNWASDAHWRLLPVLLLAVLVVIWFAVRDNLATLRRLSQDQ